MFLKNISFALTIGFFLTGFQSCKKAETTPLTATFQIKEVIPAGDFTSKETYDTDSISTAEIQFLANQPEDSLCSYAWKIGSDPRIFTQRNTSLWFPPGLDSATVSLMVNKKNVNGIVTETKTTSRTFYIRPSRVEGHYVGNFEGVAQKADVYIMRNYIMHGWQKGILITTNIPKFDSLFSPNDWREHLILNRRIYFDWANTTADGINTTIRFPHGSISLEEDYKTLTIDLIVTEVSTGKKIPMKFKGLKIL